MFVAIDRGYFADEGLKIELTRIEDNPTLVNEVSAGKLDLAVAVGAPTVFSAYGIANGTFNIIHSNFDTPQVITSFIIAKTNSTISNLEDLAGKRIGILPANVHSKVIVSELLKKNSIDPAGVVFVDLPPQLQPQALEAGQVDALYAFDPVATILMDDYNATLVMPVDRTFLQNPYYGGSLLISGQFTKERPEAARRVVRALNKAIDYIAGNEPDARLSLVRYTAISNRTALNLRSKFYFLKPTEINETLLQNEADLFFKKGIIKQRINTTGMVYRG
ncbi:MAG: ABC transporter substrate-binding protein [Candidatus Micrarchaeota archaeon]